MHQGGVMYRQCVGYVANDFHSQPHQSCISNSSNGIWQNAAAAAASREAPKFRQLATEEVQAET
jgi:hypothetical protein